jgi:bacterioferritin (cytochrome b1)
LAHGAEQGASRARTVADPILRARWLAIAAARAEHRERVGARIATLRGRVPPRRGEGVEVTGELAKLLRADLATSHALAARCRRVARLASALGDPESGALLERLAAESLGHAAELARALALHYAREARAAAQ